MEKHEKVNKFLTQFGPWNDVLRTSNSIQYYTDWLIDDHFVFSRYNNDLELEDAIHTAILTLKVCFLW